MMKEISEEAFADQARTAIEVEKKDDDDSNDDNGNGGSMPRGTLLFDATCCPSDIHYRTDIGLLNHARELTETIIDNLHEQLTRLGVTKPRTYRQIARLAFMAYARKRKHSYGELRFAIRQQLQYVRRNLNSIVKQVELGANLTDLSMDLYQKLQTIAEPHLQQKAMYDKNTHSIPNRIVSISQPHLRPIVRGKANAPVEFGAKVTTAHIGGFFL